jgi:hypothetical protein
MTTYYVSTNTGSNSNNGTSVTSALQTMQAAANLTKPGDTVIVESGTYTSASGGAVLSINISGTAAAPITYEAAPGATAIISVSSSNSAGINVDASYINVDGFQVQGDAQSLTLAQAESQGADNATTANGINIGYYEDPTIVSHVQVLNDTVSYMPGGGIQAGYADYVTVKGNTVYGNANYSTYGESGISIYGSQNSDNSTAIKNFILDNTVYDNKELVPENGTGAITDGEGIIIDDNSNSQTNGVQYTGGTLVENNVVYDNGSEGIQVGNSSNVDVLYNTTYENGQSGVNPYEIAAVYSPNAVIENNIMYANTGARTEAVYDSPDATWNYNDLYNGSTSVTNGANTVTANPLFVNAAAGNFATTSGSPAIGAANSAYPAATDITGASRPATGAEMGAYQYVAPAPTPTPTPTTTPTHAPDTLSLYMSEDAYNGDAQFTVSVNGAQVGGTMTASALHATGDSNVFILTGNWGANAAVQVHFLNDAYGGSPSTDRNLYVNAASYDGQTMAGASLYTDSTDTLQTGSASTATAPADTLTLFLSQDYYLGDADFTLTIDGKQITTPQPVSTLHGSGAWEDFTFAGNFGAGTHQIAVTFTNDAYGGSPSSDRNLYVDGISVNGTHYGTGVSALYTQGSAATFSVPTSH